jgi:hypothetical protein
MHHAPGTNHQLQIRQTRKRRVQHGRDDVLPAHRDGRTTASDRLAMAAFLYSIVAMFDTVKEFNL